MSLDGLVELSPLLLDGDEELGEVALEPELDEPGLELIDPELEPVAEDGELLLEGLREAPVLEPGPLLQPYSPPMAITAGRITTAVFFSILIRAPLGR